MEDIKRVYEVFLDEVRSSDNLREYEQYFMFNDLNCISLFQQSYLCFNFIFLFS